MSGLPSLGSRGEGWVIIQAILLAALAAAGLLGPTWIDAPRLATTIAGTILLILGATLAIRATRDLREALTPLPYPRDDAELVETGVYALVRHPIYGGLIVAGLGWACLTASFAAIGLTGVLLTFFELKARREEIWLVERFPAYAAYRDRTRRFIPWIG